MHTIYPVTDDRPHSRSGFLRQLLSRADRVRILGTATLLLLTFLFATAPSHYEPVQGTFLALACSAALLGTLPAASSESCERAGDVHRARREVALMGMSVAVFLAIWLGVEISTWS